MGGNPQDPFGVFFEFIKTQHVFYEYQILIFVAMREARFVHLGHNG
jgi:hypothetical protein